MKNKLQNSEYNSEYSRKDLVCTQSRYDISQCKNHKARLDLLQRQRNRRAWKILFGIGFLILVISLARGVFFDKVEAGVEIEKKYISVEVQYGDTLWGFATEYADKNYYDSKQEYIREVCRINNMESTTIYQGKRIALPVIVIRK